jgi:hypothetical protein
MQTTWLLLAFIGAARTLGGENQVVLHSGTQMSKVSDCDDGYEPYCCAAIKIFRRNSHFYCDGGDPSQFLVMPCWTDSLKGPGAVPSLKDCDVNYIDALGCCVFIEVSERCSMNTLPFCISPFSSRIVRRETWKLSIPTDLLSLEGLTHCESLYGGRLLV